MNTSLGHLVAILHRNNQIYLNTHLKAYGITSAEVGVLMNLFKEEGKTQEELSKWLHIDKAATTRTVHTLEEKGIIIRKQDDRDHRCNRIFLTEKGKTLETKVVPVVLAWSDHISKITGKETYSRLCNDLASIFTSLKKEPIQ
ncbi:MarR family winged helix-turn-helix transcriptional regulator [Sphaerochaeta halotolerans]|jgi:DNA-binding MarR family transcriptional regulator|uniref:MarR family winged helix-turn-helix transcriptional regulator n=1 Tax=Sphaerochaeta halotolerans TaxID=2293840 RepID=UPI0013683A7F|nr:MarR family transcriptional regulator [Sphaerochaeta halotolerans]MXI87681.1 MarR family transcriptional regulator [Sphaerochaeta halotolerans]